MASVEHGRGDSLNELPPPGSPTAVRWTKRGNPAQFGVTFGTSGGSGQGVVRVEESPRLAG
jgi:hypothetical protein